MGRALRLSRISNGPRACMGPARVHETRKGSQGAVVKRRWDGRQGSIHPILIFFSIQGERLHLKIDFLFIEGVSVPLFSFDPGF